MDSRYYVYDNKSRLPGFVLDNCELSILKSPSEFYQTLVKLIQSSERRIVLTSLYIGSSSYEKRLIKEIENVCRQQQRRRLSCKKSLKSHTIIDNQKESAVAANVTTSSSDAKVSNPNSLSQYLTHDSPKTNSSFHSQSDFKDSGESTMQDSSGEISKNIVTKVPTYERSKNMEIDLLFDHARGTRIETNKYGKKMSSIVTLFPLLKLKSEADEKALASSSSCSLHINIGLFHSPMLCYYLHKYLPQRINEIFGVFHTKIIIVDDTVLISGANIQKLYFTTRQDRYLVIKNAPDLADFLQQLVQVIQRVSFQATMLRSDLLAGYEPSAINSRNSEDTLDDRIIFELRQRLPGDRLRNCQITPRAQIIFHSESNFPLFLKLSDICTYSPITEPEYYNREFSLLLQHFLDTYKYADQNKLINAETTINVALQVPFVNPPICHEELLLDFILKPANSFKKATFIFDRLKEIPSLLLNRFFELFKFTESVLEKSKVCSGIDQSRTLTYPEYNRYSENAVTNNPKNYAYASSTCESDAVFYDCISLDDDDDADHRHHHNTSAEFDHNELDITLNSEIPKNKKSFENLIFGPGDSKKKGFSKYPGSRIFGLFQEFFGLLECLIIKYVMMFIKIFKAFVYTVISFLTIVKELMLDKKSNISLDGCMFPIKFNGISKIVITSGYFNMNYALLRKLILAIRQSSFVSQTNETDQTPSTVKSCANNKFPLEIYVASDKANSFFRSKGVSKYIPVAYKFVSFNQFMRIQQIWKFYHNPLDPGVPLFKEYKRPQWTYHSKGLWIYNCVSNLPCATLIGSSNLGLRSSTRDLDVSFFLQTKNTNLQLALQDEISSFQNFLFPIDLNSIHANFPFWIKVLLRFQYFRSFL